MLFWTSLRDSTVKPPMTSTLCLVECSAPTHESCPSALQVIDYQMEREKLNSKSMATDYQVFVYRARSSSTNPQMRVRPSFGPMIEMSKFTFPGNK